MMVLGLDTSNYTTSAAAFDGVSGKNCSRLLDVREGELGLRQSDALFSHVKRLPELVEKLLQRFRETKSAPSAHRPDPERSKGHTCPVFWRGPVRRRIWQRFWACRFMRFPISRGTSRLPAGLPGAWI